MPAVVDVWWARPGDERDAHVALLNQGERERRDRYRQGADRARFTVGSALLRAAAGSAVGRAAGDIEVDRTCPRCGEAHGAPRLPGTGLYASISHAGDQVVVALTADGPVGVDVEEIRKVEEDLLPLVLSPDEPFTLAGQRTLFVHWTRKEALVKATGDGLNMPLRDVVLGTPERPPAVVRYGTQADLRAALTDIDPGAGYVGCVAVLAVDACEIRNRDGTALLASVSARSEGFEPPTF